MRFVVPTFRSAEPSIGASSVHHRYAISTRSVATSAHARTMKRQSASRAACQTAFGSLCHSSRAVRPAAITTRAARAKPPERAALVVFCCRVLLPVSIVGICTGIVAVIIAGPWALAYVPLYVLATLPGWPLGRVLFGRHPASWVFGALAGYGLTCLAFWAVIAAGIPSAMTFVLAWAVVSAARGRSASGDRCKAGSPRCEGRSREGGPLVELPPWTAHDARILVFLLLLVPAVFVFPYKNLGAQDAHGNRFYRAYFTADFIWHTALTAELMKYDMPPINPYLGDRTIQYYWTYFVVPAVVAQEGPGGLNDVELALKVNALLSGAAVSGRVDCRDVERVAFHCRDGDRRRAGRAGRQRRGTVHGRGILLSAGGQSRSSSTSTSTPSPRGNSTDCESTASCDRCGTTLTTRCLRRWHWSPCRWPVPREWPRRLAQSLWPGSCLPCPRPSIRWSAACSR